MSKFKQEIEQHGSSTSKIFNQIDLPSEEQEEMNKMAHDVSETVRYI